MGAGNGTIGSTGLYPDPATWEADIPATLTEPCIGELLAEEFVGSGIVLDISGHTTSPTNKIILRPTAGCGFRDHPTAATNPLRYDATKGAAIRSTGGAGSMVIRANGQANVEIDGVQIFGTGGYGPRGVFLRGSNVVVKNCLIEMTGSGQIFAARLETSTTTKIINTIAILRATGSGNPVGLYLSEVAAPGGFYNCVSVKPSGVGNAGAGFAQGFQLPTIKNCASFGWATAFGSADAASSDYNAGDGASAPGSHSLTGLVYGDQFEDIVNGTHDFRLKAGSALIDAGIDDATNAPADIIGTTRPQGSTSDIGVWEFASGGGTPSTEIMTGALDAILVRAMQKAATLDALLSKRLTASADLDAVLRRAGITKTVLLDAILQNGHAAIAALDAILIRPGLTRTASLDAVLRRTFGVAVETDALLQKRVALGAFMDAIVGELPAAPDSGARGGMIVNPGSLTQR